MARLPQVGGDAGNWGEVLNEYLSQIHKDDGTLKDGAVKSSQIAADAVNERALGVSGGTDGQVLTKDTSSSTGISWKNPGGGTATAVTMGGDLNGQSNNAQIVAGAVGSAELSNGAVVAAKIADGTITETKLDTAIVNKLNAAGSGNVADGSITAAKLNTTGGTNGQVLVLDSSVAGGFKWQTVSSGSATPTGAAGGALAGTYPNPTLANNAVATASLNDGAVTLAKLSTTGTPSNGQVLTYNGTGLSWTTPATGGTGSGDPTVGGDLSGTASNAQIVANAVGTTEIANNAVTTAKLPDSAITTAKVADSAVTEAKLAISNSPSADQVLSWDGSAMRWAAAPTGGGTGTGSSGFNVVAKNSTYTASDGDYVLASATTGELIINLPAPSLNAQVCVKKVDNSANSVTIKATTAIDEKAGTTGFSLPTQWWSQDFLSDGNQWYCI